MRRDIVAMLFWALRWHEGHRVSYRLLADVLWGDFASKPEDAAGSIRELIAWVEKRYGDKWIIEDCHGRAFRILPRPNASRASLKIRRRTASPPQTITPGRILRGPGQTKRPISFRHKAGAATATASIANQTVSTPTPGRPASSSQTDLK